MESRFGISSKIGMFSSNSGRFDTLLGVFFGGGGGGGGGACARAWVNMIGPSHPRFDQSFPYFGRTLHY